jgi:hypothetical protein
MGNSLKKKRPEIAVVFYKASLKKILNYGEDDEEGYIQYTIYKESLRKDKVGLFEIIQLSDGRRIAANELWCDLDSWVKIPPPDAIIGELVTNRYVNESYVF